MGLDTIPVAVVVVGFISNRGVFVTGFVDVDAVVGVDMLDVIEGDDIAGEVAMRGEEEEDRVGFNPRLISILGGGGFNPTS